MSGSGLNRINIVIPASSSTAAAQRDESITKLIAVLGATTQFDLYKYADTNSGLGIWGYYAIGYGYVGGTVVIATVTCTGMWFPPSGSNLAATSDPGPGALYTWTAIGAPHSISTPLGGGGSVPQGNNNYYVWNIPGNSTTAVADFTAAVTAVNSSVPGTTVRQGFKYVDSVSGAWQVWWICFGAGSAEYAASSATILANNNILYMVTCAGTPHPPTGSSQPAIALMPAFTQIFTTLSAPLSFGPQR
jgi:hypothetical protein